MGGLRTVMVDIAGKNCDKMTHSAHLLLTIN
jgi:hypothetical protein